MTDSDYDQGPQRRPIQIERKERGDWIVWNWRTVSWDEKPQPVSTDGEGTPTNDR